jgi:molybdate transport system substrate-binding protein
VRARRVLAAAVVAAALGLAGCAAVSSPVPEGATATPDLDGDLTVYAAASLSASFDEIAAAFAAAHPGANVRPMVYDGSSTLVTQLTQGAEADVFASADERTMAEATDAGLVEGDPVLFATNTLVIAVPPGNPAGVESLDDLADDGVTVVLCAPEVPCGAASTTLLRNAGAVVKPASLEQNVTAVLTKVASGDADSGLVYATDVRGRADVDAVAAEGAESVVNRYPIAALSGADDPVIAAAFVAFVTGPEGQAILAAHGFGAPPAG